ncbi:cytidylyltransferase family-domain-containing protein [Limtongia smithiae]|uniref:cytidylyltransferase family-domain-containing protein n=1 Tax=Limtongia smithiae TaxID=1125753 RepID=UPI0034CD4A4D
MSASSAPRKRLAASAASASNSENGLLKVPTPVRPVSTNGKTKGASHTEDDSDVREALTPRSRTPLGIIASHSNYRNFIHKYEVPRKLLHVSIGFLTIVLYFRGITLNSVTPVLIFLLTGVVALDVLRFRSAAFLKIYIRAFGSLMRESEVDKWNGIVWYLLGLIIVFIGFPKDISILAVLLLSWSDTAASSFGRAFGHLTPKLFRNKSLAGSFAAFLTGTVAAYLLYGFMLPAAPQLNTHDFLAWTPETSSLPLSALCTIAGIVGASAEAVDLYGLDDNITIPVISAIVMHAILYFCRI